MLSKKWKNRKKDGYDFVVVGSGYGGGITAARISAAKGRPKKTVCLLERGKEWPVGSFPDGPLGVVGELRSPVRPLGLYEFDNFSDISVIRGSGLGGTSLINANVAIVPDEEVFDQSAWPKSVTLNELRPFYKAAQEILAVVPHPNAHALLKVKALDRRAREIGAETVALDLAVHFKSKGKNPHGVKQKPCIDCGDCCTGCNVGAKNTVYMNYLAMAANNGTDIFTKTQVDWIEPLKDGGWKIHGRRYRKLRPPKKFELEAANVILSAGALGTTEILLRSELRGKLSVSPRLGTSFSGNGDFFGVSYNSDHQTNVLGFGNRPNHRWTANAPGPNIVGAIRYDKNLPYDQRITVEDFSFPKAYVRGAMLAFGAINGDDTDLGDEGEERVRRLLDNRLKPYRHAHGALNHSMLYLVMGHDDAKGTMHLNTGPGNRRGKLEIDWDDAGRQPLFNRINKELYRHARALGAHFIANPLWDIMNLRHLVTAHPMGGCPMGEDYLHGAVDEFGRVFAGDGSVHKGLYVADGSLIPSALGVNPFLTISALSERIADRLVKHIGGKAYPAPPKKANFSRIDPLEVIRYKEADLERLFERVETGPVKTLVNRGGLDIDVDRGFIRNDTVWKGFFPRGHILNQFSNLFATGFKKRFVSEGGKITGITSDSDERINAPNTIEEIDLKKRKGPLAAGRYILLRYTSAPWTGFYDIFKVISEDLLIGQVYLGTFPRGVRLFTFPMTRVYGLDNMTAKDHQALYQESKAPSKEQLAGLWEMRGVSNAVNTGTVAYLKFDHKPDDRLEARYQFLGFLEGIVEPVFGQDHFQLNDFTPFHDEIRRVSDDFMVGKYTAPVSPRIMDLFGPASLGLFHLEKGDGDNSQLSFYYTLRRSSAGEMPAPGFLQPLLDVRLPDGLGMTFDEEMSGDFFPGLNVKAGREGDEKLENLAAARNRPEKAVACSVTLKVKIRDMTEFLESPEHEADVEGTIHFSDYAGKGKTSFQLKDKKSTFKYFRVNPETKEAEILYHLYFEDNDGKEQLFFGRKYMQKDQRGGITGIREIVHDYTTLYCRLTEVSSGKEAGAGLLKFRTFEDLDAVGDFADFLTSYRVTGTDDLVLKSQAILRFLAFTSQFIFREYDPLNPGEIFAN